MVQEIKSTKPKLCKKNKVLQNNSRIPIFPLYLLLTKSFSVNSLCHFSQNPLSCEIINS